MRGLNVSEGPVALQHDGDTFIVYSASFCGTPDYRLGMLRYNGGDPMTSEAWDKQPEPAFERSDENGVFGPGHNGFFRSPDGTEDWIVYHANDSLDGSCDGRRMTRVQHLTQPAGALRRPHVWRVGADRGERRVGPTYARGADFPSAVGRGTVGGQRRVVPDLRLDVAVRSMQAVRVPVLR